MPTGYTADIKDGITFKQYALNCARAFGALIHMRDDPMDAPIKKDQCTDYHKKKIEAAHQGIEKLNAMTPFELDHASRQEWEDEEKSRQKHLAENAAQIAAYKSMLEEVNAWEPPTADHADYHTFMKEQIEKSISFDDHSDFYSTPSEKLTGEEWKKKQLAKFNHDLEYHSEQQQEEEKRVGNRNDWVDQLLNSLPD